jgi:phage terminase small subunit
MATVSQRIKCSLIEQLSRKNAKEYHFEKLVDDYCELYDIKAKLIKDVKETGVTITEYNVKGFEVHKANPAISEISKISGAMLKILSQLNISAEDNISQGEENNDTGL